MPSRPRKFGSCERIRNFNEHKNRSVFFRGDIHRTLSALAANGTRVQGSIVRWWLYKMTKLWVFCSESLLGYPAFSLQHRHQIGKEIISWDFSVFLNGICLKNILAFFLSCSFILQRVTWLRAGHTMFSTREMRHENKQQQSLTIISAFWARGNESAYHHLQFVPMRSKCLALSLCVPERWVY